MRVRKAKKYNLDGKQYTLRQIAELQNLSLTSVRNKLRKGAKSLKDINNKQQSHIHTGVNWKSSMMNDELGHWKLLGKALCSKS